MSETFKQEDKQFAGKVSPVTPYQRAGQVWDDRMGSARAQASHWRFIAFIALCVALLSLFFLSISVFMEHDRVYVAQVSEAGQVINVAPLRVPYQPTVAQEEYFLGQFIKQIRGVPLDPVVAKQNWNTAYAFLTERAATQMNQFLQQSNPLTLLGKQTVTVDVTAINPVSENTYEVDWTENVVGTDGKAESAQNWSGIFTLMTKAPTTQAVILVNPLGLYIVDFHISQRTK